MTYTISTVYDKTKLYPVDHGYDLRSGAAIKALLIHSTDGNYGSSFENEAAFLRDSAKVSAHFLVGKQGRIACIVPPSFRAWHSGEVSPPAFSNDTSIGIETHYTTRETWPQAGQDALTWLVKQLIQQFGITKNNIDTHRKVAIPAGRKPDPLQFSDQQFYAWRDSLFPAKLTTYVVNTTGTSYIRQGPAVAYPIAGTLHQGDTIVVDKIIAGQDIKGNNQWAHVSSGLGFVTMTVLKEVVT
jgi:N-acetyl-anhydromuramyl-L-alanine amidase AmpD